MPACQKKILAVDDDSVLRRMYSDILTESGYSVETASNGLDAFNKLLGSAFDLVVTDINMPLLDGIGLYLAATRRHPYLRNRFLFITGNPEAELEAISVISEFKSACISKPFKLQELMDHVGSITAVPLEDAVARHGLKIRGEERVVSASACYLFSKGEGSAPIVSKAKDLSAGGIRLQYVGDPLDAGTEVDLNIESMDLVRRARVVWASGAGKYRLVTAGLKFTEPLPPSVLHS
ncbi:MAG: response regulator [Deltaproteobacteria bacterium]|nr:response regulator [Deltaproteobacteria bacterium]